MPACRAYPDRFIRDTEFNHLRRNVGGDPHGRRARVAPRDCEVSGLLRRLPYEVRAVVVVSRTTLTCVAHRADVEQVRLLWALLRCPAERDLYYAVHVPGPSGANANASGSRIPTPTGDPRTGDSPSATGANTPVNGKDGNVYFECLECKRQVRVPLPPWPHS